MSVTRVRRLESVWGKCVRMLTKGAGQCGVAVLIKELGLSSVHATMSNMRARAAGKYPELRTVIQQLASTEHPAGVIIAEVQPGYTIGDYLLRAAMVVVSKGAPSAESAN